jgi:NitT/TauT family transport system substrate-binding protein
MKTAYRLLLAAAWVVSLSNWTLAQKPKEETGLAADAELVETRTEVPKLKAPAEYKMKDGVLEIELSEYAGYSGLIVANNGMDPNEDSIFFKKHGLKVKLSVSEEESWSALNSGKMAAAPTTVDVLPVYSRQMDVKVPVLIGFSRGADGIVVRKDIKKINNLKGKIVATCQFTEADFLLRYLVQETGTGINMLPDLAAKPDPEKVNVVYCADAFGAGDLFLRDLKSGRNRLAGCVTWAPKTTEVAAASEGKAGVLVTNKNLLIVADILLVNGGFAKANPKAVGGLVAGLLEGNSLVRENPDRYLPIIAKAFKWKPENAKGELAKVHLANFPENQAFFAGTLDSAGSFEYIYETAGYVYGNELIGNPADASKFLDGSHLAAVEKAGTFKDQKASITPLRAKATTAENTPDAQADMVAVLSKDIRFKFKPNSSKLDQANPENQKGLESIAQLVKISPGSTVLLRGHADGSLAMDAKKSGQEARARDMLLDLKRLSKTRCTEVKQVLEEKFKIDPARIESQGVGADEPTGKGPDADRRVEVLWMVLE